MYLDQWTSKGIECDISAQTEEILMLGNPSLPYILRILKLPNIFKDSVHGKSFSFLAILYSKHLGSQFKYM